MWKYLAHGKSSWHLSFFFSRALIKVHWIPYCVSGPPFLFPRASHLRSPFHPCHCGLNSVFTFIYLWRKRPQAQLGFGSAERYYFCIYGSWTQEDVWMGNAQGNHCSSLFANLAVNTETPVPHPKASALPGAVWCPGICIWEKWRREGSERIPVSFFSLKVSHSNFDLNLGNAYFLW